MVLRITAVPDNHIIIVFLTCERAKEFIDSNQFLGSAIIPTVSSYASCDWVFNAGDLGDRAARVEEIQGSETSVKS